MLGYGGQVENIDGIEGNLNRDNPSLNKESGEQTLDRTASEVR
jgi:hypothetical protein